MGLRERCAGALGALACDARAHPERFGDDWSGLTLEQQRRALLDVLAEVVVRPARRPYTTFDAGAVELVFRGD